MKDRSIQRDVQSKTKQKTGDSLNLGHLQKISDVQSEQGIRRRHSSRPDGRPQRQAHSRQPSKRLPGLTISLLSLLALMVVGGLYYFWLKQGTGR